MAYRLIDQRTSTVDKTKVVCHYQCDSTADFANLPTAATEDGSDAFVPSTCDVAVLHNGSWVTLE